jgi:hydrogenase maturation protein HypF
MAAFTLCSTCQSEYRTPSDRRFHSQTQSCGACGPRLWLSDAQGLVVATEHALAACAERLALGHIVAIKGIGGFHLACDAGNDAAVKRLRQAKQRDSKAFAIMANLTLLADYVDISPQAAEYLQQPAAPIVLLPKHGLALSDAVAPDSDALGCMLPYSALHHLLLQQLTRPLVLTSGNPHDDPPCLDNAEALAQLAGIADAFLLHDRAITRRLDDSVLRPMADHPQLLRRARGYCPLPLPLPAGFGDAPVVLAMGADLKNSACLLANGQAQLTAYGGDLSNPSNLSRFRNHISQLPRDCSISVQAIAIDGHPAYLSSQWGKQCAQDLGLPLLTVQHHHAHLAACMAEHRLPRNSPPVIGVALDGLGYGDDGQLWGGEFMAVQYHHYQRLAAFESMALLGGSQAIKQPWRIAYAHLSQHFDWPSLCNRYGALPFMDFLRQQPLTLLERLKNNPQLSPLSSSCGRALDALAACLGSCRDSISYEGQAAMGLETLAATAFATQHVNGYPLAWQPDHALPRLSWQPLWQALLHDMQQAIAPNIIAARIHHGLAAAIADTRRRGGALRRGAAQRA